MIEIVNIEIVNRFERAVYGVLMVMLMTVLLAALVELCWLMYTSLASPSIFLFENRELVTILGAFLLVLIGVELLDTIKAYFKENTVHFEVVIILAIIAIARKVILLDPATTNGLELIGIGFMVLGLAGGYYLLKLSGIATYRSESPPEIR